MKSKKRPLVVDSVTELIGDTPLIKLKRVADAKAGAEIWAKLEVNNPGGSIKDRPCLKMIEDAEEQGILKAGATIIEPTTGNTGIGLALICAVKGYKCVLTMPEDLSLERIYLLRKYGAEVILTPAKKGVAGAIAKAKELHAKIKNSFMPLQFQSPSNPAAHRESTGPEIWEATDGKVDAFVAGVGTGGTITGVGEYLKEKNPAVKIIAVEPKNSAVLTGRKPGIHKIQGIGAGFIPEILNRKIIDQIIAVDDYEAFAMTKALGSKEGLSVGISSGANVVASLEVARALGPGNRVVTILCDTGDRYFTLERYFQA